MFGADTPLVMDALQIAAIAAGLGAGAVYLALRRRKNAPSASAQTPKADPSRLEERVQVLERIATDRSVDLADEIEALRVDTKVEEKSA